jgi:predicted ATPase/DNA-binding CsgD family transcriptional regulator
MPHNASALPGQFSRGETPRHAQDLPLQPTTFIGREHELAAAREILLRDGVRLLTLTGPPGTGKTRLGLQLAADVAADFADGIYFVPLAPIRDAGLVVAAIYQGMELREEGSLPLLERLKFHLQGKQVLMLLDNFEHVMEAAPQVAELLSACPRLKVLVTSRELLHLYGEHDYPVPPLSLPDPNTLPDFGALSQYEAVTLFLQRARALNPRFELTDQNANAVAEICLRLDGLPLAIELAAARILVLSPEELLARLASSLKLLTGGARNLPERHRTMRATIDWSYNLLDAGEQTLFRRLGVFVGGCTLEAIEEICVYGSEPGEPGIDALDRVTSLIGKSLMQRQVGWGTGEPRFMMLETVGEYARQKLEESGELDATGDRCLDYFLQFAESAEQETLGREAALWMRRLDAEQNNMRAALEWSLAREGRTDKGLRLAGALVRYWQYRGYFSEGLQWCAQLLSKTEPAEPSAERAKALRGLARMYFEQGDFTEAGPIYEQSLEMARAVGDEQGVAGALFGLGGVSLWHGEYDLSPFEECLAIGRKLGSRYLISNALSMIGTIHMRKEEYEAAKAPLEESLAIDREVGDDAGIALTLCRQGSVTYHLGDYEKARELIEESLVKGRELGADLIIAICLARLGMIALHQGDAAQAEAFLIEGLARARTSGNKRWSRWYLVGLAEVARLGGKAERAAILVGASEGAIGAAGVHYEPAISAAIERIKANVRARLDEETFAKLSAEGRAMPLEEIITLAGSPGRAARAATTGGQQANPDDLTEREIEVLRLIAVGKSNLEIGQELVLSRRTVERHISNIYEKIGASGKVARAAATAYALRRGLAT